MGAGNPALETGLPPLGACFGTNRSGYTLHIWAGALDFRDFSGPLDEKENRTGIVWTLPLYSLAHNRDRKGPHLPVWIDSKRFQLGVTLKRI